MLIIPQLIPLFLLPFIELSDGFSTKEVSLALVLFGWFVSGCADGMLVFGPDGCLRLGGMGGVDRLGGKSGLECCLAIMGFGKLIGDVSMPPAPGE